MSVRQERNLSCLLALLRNRHSSCKESPIRRFDFRPIDMRRPGSPKLSSIRNRIVETVMLFFDIVSGSYRNGRRHLSPLNDYRQQSAALPS
ncbi:hypothetical protein EVAR_75735_1 [Eumeta japonica]|uniref:Uncharacterized protein n=1 Tax=Eumeta variegata TaxID=151549 RepID=A0A4C1TCT7_EUMVA|nr:hypothetical protein EVAR_75735_1 [Eumeta japonica]